MAGPQGVKMKGDSISTGVVFSIPGDLRTLVDKPSAVPFLSATAFGLSRRAKREPEDHRRPLPGSCSESNRHPLTPSRVTENGTRRV